MIEMCLISKINIRYNCCVCQRHVLVETWRTAFIIHQNSLYRSSDNYICFIYYNNTIVIYYLFKQTTFI